VVLPGVGHGAGSGIPVPEFWWGLEVLVSADVVPELDG
jgi:hypothetical protein